MNSQILYSFVDELEKLAVSPEWIERHARRGALQRATHIIDSNAPDSAPDTTRTGRVRGEGALQAMERRHPEKFDRETVSPKRLEKYKALHRGIYAAADDFDRGARMRHVGPTFLQKHWKKGVGLGAAGLAAGAYGLHKKRKNKERR